MSWKNVPHFAADFVFSNFAAAIATREDGCTGIYTADLKRDWCIGFVPHGGYITSLLLSTATSYMHTHPSVARLSQPHALHITTTFFRACTPGRALITITPAKTGRTYTFLRAALSQGSHARLEALVAFTNFDTLQHGPTLATTEMVPRRIPSRVEECVEWKVRVDARPAVRNLRYFVQKGTHGGSWTDGEEEEGRGSVREQWVGLADGERMGVVALGYLGDMFLPLPENYPSTAKSYWYPTLTLSTEIKRLPPPSSAGWEWLFCRVYAREIQNGRMDINVDIFDDQHNLVAIVHQVAIIVSNDRNRPREEEGEGAKL